MNSTTDTTMVWGRFGPSSTEEETCSGSNKKNELHQAPPKKVSNWNAVRQLFGIRRTIDAGRNLEARAKASVLNSRIKTTGNPVLSAVLAEMQAEIEVIDGRLLAAEKLLRDHVIPGYSGLPGVIASRTWSSLNALQQVRHANREL